MFKTSFIGLILLLIVGGAATLSLAEVLPLDTAGPAAAEGWLQREVNVLAAVQTHDERWNVYHLLADAVDKSKSN